MKHPQSRVSHVIYSCLLALMFNSACIAQDAHFSQFYASPLTLNPALAGTAAGTYRVTVNYRDQWTGALSNSLTTFAAAGDLNFKINDDQRYSDIAGLGFLFFGDRVGQFDLNTNKVALMGSYHKSLNQRSAEYLGVGLQVGISQKGINYEDLTFQDQFDAIAGFTNPSGELLPNNSLAYGDFAIGINYHSANRDKQKIYAGISYAHFNAPNISFYRENTDPNPSLIKESVLDPKLTIHLGASFRRGQRLDVQPRVLALLQGVDTQINVGNNFRFGLDDRGTKYFNVGPWIRAVNNENGFGVESIVASIGLELGGMMIGFSYDHNVGDLVNDYVGLNAFELSITFVGDHENEDNFCPTF